MGGCCSHLPEDAELHVNTETRPPSNDVSLNDQKKASNSPVSVILGDLVTSFNDIDSQRHMHIHNLLKMVPNTIKILLNSNYEKELYHIYLETRILVKLRYEEYKNMEHQFNSIDEIIIKIEKQIQNNIHNSILLTRTTPKILIDTLKICEFEDNDHNIKTLYHSNQDWAAWKHVQSTDTDDTDDTGDEKKDLEVMNDAPKDSMKCKVKSEIESFILKSVEKLTFYKENEIKKCLSGIDDILFDLSVINNKMGDIFPKHYDIINYFIQTYFTFFKGLLFLKLDDNKIETQNKLFVLSWIDSFKTKLLDLPHRAMIMDVLNDQYDIILTSYMNTLTNKLSLRVTKMIKNESIKQEYFMVDYIPRIHSIQSLLTLLNEQLSIIINCKLKKDTFIKLIKVILMSADTFSDLLLKYIQLNINTNRVQFKDEYCFALLNSSYSVTIKLKIHLKNILKDNTNSEKIENNLEDLFDAIIIKFTNIAKICSIQIGEKTVKDNIKIDECFAIKNLDSDDDDGCGGFIKAKMLILKYQCEILEKSIDEKYFFNEIIKSIINNMIEEYIESIITLNKVHFDAKQLSNCIEMDMNLLKEYFNEFGDDIKKCWSNEYKILHATCAAFVCEDGFLDAFVKPLREHKFGDELIKFIKKKRRMQSLINKTSLLRLKIKNISFKKKGNDS